MSRSKHTRPREVRAADRVRDPHAPRGRNDERRRRTARRVLKELGLSQEDAPVDSNEKEAQLPRVIEKRPRRDHVHPAARADILRVLEFFGPACFYGLRSIELTQAPSSEPSGFLLGRLCVPGRVLVYDQRPSPWRFAGPRRDDQLERLERAGAQVETDERTKVVEVSWPGETLRDFMLFDVLMHEIGHHLLQHHKGKRTVHIARTQDHEAFADQFASRCRLAFQQDESP